MLAGCTGGGSERTETAEEPANPRLRVGDRALSSAFPVELVEPDAGNIDAPAHGDARIGSVHWHEDERHTHWHFGPLEVPRGGTREVRIRYLDQDLETVPVGDGEPYRVDVSVVSASPEGLLSVEQDGDRIILDGEAVGDGRLGLELRCNGELAWEAPELEVAVIEGETGDG